METEKINEGSTVPEYVRKPSKEAERFFLFQSKSAFTIKIVIGIIIALLSCIILVAGGYLLFLFIRESKEL